MANFTAADVKRLRELTGAGMMDCKKALDEADGDFDKAVEILRVKGAKDVDKRADRVAANGLVAVAGARDHRAQLRDRLRRQERAVPGARRPDRRRRRRGAAGRRRRRAGARRCGRPDRRRRDRGPGRGHRREARAAPGRRPRRPGRDLPARKDPDLPPQVGVLVEYEGEDAEAARAVAMQIAAMRPPYLTRDEVPADVVENERRVAEATAREEGKPEAALPKIVEGRVNGFFKDRVLLEQESVHEAKKTVGQVARRGRASRSRLRPVRGRPGLSAPVRRSRPAVAVRHTPGQDRAAAPRRQAGRREETRWSTASSWTVPPTGRSSWPTTPGRAPFQPGAAQAVRRGVRRRRRARRRPRRGRRPSPGRSPTSSAAASRSPSSSAAATSSAAPSCPSAAWTAAAPTTWACSARS